MRRIGNLYEKICQEENIYLAYEKARKGKCRSSGVVNFEKDLDVNIKGILTEIVNETYKTPEYDTFLIHDPKERMIFRLPFRDRVVHHAIMNVLEDVWSPIFISQSYACVKGKGIHGALKGVRKAMLDVENTRYCLKMDIRKYYPSVDHEVLKSIIRKKIKDDRLLKLLDGIIDSAPGIPIGNYLSQFFANLYLSYFDHWLKEEKRVRYYFRYADDMIVMDSDKKVLHSLLVEIRGYLSEELKLDVKDNWQIFPIGPRGIDFVGYVFYHDHIRMRKSIKKNFCRRASKLNKKEMTDKEYKCMLASWLGWAKHCNSRNLIKKIVRHEKIL